MGKVKEEYINNIDASEELFYKPLDLISENPIIKERRKRYMPTTSRVKINQIIRILTQHRTEYADDTLDKVLKLIEPKNIDIDYFEEGDDG